MFLCLALLCVTPLRIAKVVAQCQGHSSFVSSVAFDQLRCDGRTHRFGSVGEGNIYKRPISRLSFNSGTSPPAYFIATNTSEHTIRAYSCHLAFPSPTVGAIGSTIQLSVTCYHPAPLMNEVSIALILHGR
ncbi:hypothetical protein DFH29DRAFT_283158 [Suillus ampliporus]|nr:hypothetical protein DFH29DRAFT_283158 [Suillus ampliporus]